MSHSLNEASIWPDLNYNFGIIIALVYEDTLFLPKGHLSESDPTLSRASLSSRQFRHFVIEELQLHRMNHVFVQAISGHEAKTDGGKINKKDGKKSQEFNQSRGSSSSSSRVNV